LAVGSVKPGRVAPVAIAVLLAGWTVMSGVVRSSISSGAGLSSEENDRCNQSPELAVWSSGVASRDLIADLLGPSRARREPENYER
jgi:hypothetical protein